jgi:Na+-translocating ferredoxin:NAD+ oxidoreductase RnfE subunit
MMHDELKKSLLLSAPAATMLGLGLVAPLIAGGTLRTEALLGIVAVGSLIVSGAGVAFAGVLIPANVRSGAAVLIAAGVLTIAKITAAAVTPGSVLPVETLAPLVFGAAVIAASTEAYAVKRRLVRVLFDGVGMGLLFTVLLCACGIVRDGAGNSGVVVFFTGAAGVFFVAALVVWGLTSLRQKSSAGGAV